MSANRFFHTLIAGCMVTGLALTGCAEDPAGPSGAPELPPRESMTVDVSFFQQHSAPGVEDAAASNLNFLNAAARAFYINVGVITALTPPVAVFALAIDTVPSRDDDGAYLWIYTWREDGADNQIRLRGTIDGVHVDWELAIVQAGQPAETWFTGRSRMDRDEGYWLFHDFQRAGDPEVFRIDWDVASPRDVSLDLTNLDAASDEDGDRLMYTVSGDLNTMEFFDASESMTWDIVWNEALGTGSLFVPDYNNGNRACWDENQEDMDCAAAAPAVASGPPVR